MPQGWVFPNALGAIAAQQQVDASLGYPKPGVDVGGGRHVSPAQSATQTYAAPVPLAGAFYYPADTVTTPLLASLNLGPAGAIPYPIGPGQQDQPA
jgi:hypothetical protein